MIPPGGSGNPGGCLPAGRILEGSITLNARGTSGDTGNLFADTHTPTLAGSTTGGVGHVDFSCTNQSAVVGLKYTLIAVVDHGADDLASCGPGTLLAIGPTSCFSKLADEDNDASDNRQSRSAPKVKKPQVESGDGSPTARHYGVNESPRREKPCLSACCS